MLLLFVKIANLHKHLALKVVRKLEKVEWIWGAGENLRQYIYAETGI